MTLEFFREQMARMNGLRFAPADLQTHWEGLNELPDDVLEAAVTRAVRFRIEFPTPIELRQDADQVRPRRFEPEPEPPLLEHPVVLGKGAGGKEIVATHEWKYYCETCGDTGWREFMCGESARFPWMERKDCGENCRVRLKANYNHTFVEKCPCIDWNPEIKKRREREAKYAAERAQTR